MAGPGAGATAAPAPPLLGPAIVLVFTFSTTTAFVRPCEKLCRTMPCSTGRFSESVFGGPTVSVLSPVVLVSVISFKPQGLCPFVALCRRQSRALGAARMSARFAYPFRIPSDPSPKTTSGRASISSVCGDPSIRR